MFSFAGKFVTQIEPHRQALAEASCDDNKNSSSTSHDTRNNRNSVDNRNSSTNLSWFLVVAQIDAFGDYY